MPKVTAATEPVLMARLTSLRQALADQRLDAFLVPRADRHQGEYVPACDARLEWLTGFSGSAGVAIITSHQAALFVDGRYEVQAAAQVPSAVEVVFLRLQQPADWLLRHLSAGARVGFDPWLHTAEEIDRLSMRLVAAGIMLTPVEHNPIDRVWLDRPLPPNAPAVLHPHAGQTSAEKLTAVAAQLQKQGADATILTAPDSVCWLLNIRGRDVPRNPFLLSYAVVTADAEVTLICDPAQITPEVAAALGESVSLVPWGLLDVLLGGLRQLRIALDRSTAPVALAMKLRNIGAQVIWQMDPCALPKARKNPVELAGARAAHRRDGAALCDFLFWLDQVLPGPWNEAQLGERLHAKRVEWGQRLGMPLCDDSFDAIVGFNGNGAIVHYRADPASAALVDRDGVLLIDSGGQYIDGTTDVTRTIAVGAGMEAARAPFTQVLKGMIAVSTARFPAGCKGSELDGFARRALWAAGRDYDHGTGHGVGSYLSVHEGPARLSKAGAVALEAGMILSNEPGFYARDQFGIRIENLVVVTPAQPVPGGDRPMFGFETLTLAPIDRRLMAVELLTAEERVWLDAYHARVLAEVGPLLDAPARDWLMRACRPL